MRKYRSIRVSIMIAGSMFLVFLAQAQDMIKWERGRAVCVSTYQWDAAAGGTLNVDVNAMDVSAIGDAVDKITLTEKILLSVDNEDDAKKYYEMYRTQFKKSGSEFKFESPETHRPFRTGSLVFQIPNSFNVKVNTSGGDLEIGNITGKMNLSTSGGDIHIRDIMGETKINTSGGDISINRIHGNLAATTSGGDISAAHCSPEISVNTSGGDLELAHLSGSLIAATSGGDIALTDLDGGANLSTSGGDIEIIDVKGNKTVNASTSGGDIVAGNINADITLSTSSGDIRLTAIEGTVAASTSNGDISGSNIEGSTIRAQTSSGDIDLRFVSGNMKVATSNGDLSIRMKKSDSSSEAELTASSGDIICTLPSSYKASVIARIRNWDKKSDYTISSDFDLKIRTENSHNRVAIGDINGGGPQLRIVTSGGDISIKKY